MIDYRIFFVKGDTYNLQVKLKTSITEIKGVYFTAINSSKVPKIQKKLNDGISYDEENKAILITLKPSDTINLEEDEVYLYDLKIDYGENDSKTLLRGNLIAGWGASESEV